MTDTARVGSTLSQVGLALRLRRSAKWVRREGELVTGFVPDRGAGRYETWARMEWSNKRCAGYKRVS